MLKKLFSHTVWCCCLKRSVWAPFAAAAFFVSHSRTDEGRCCSSHVEGTAEEPSWCHEVTELKGGTTDEVFWEQCSSVGKRSFCWYRHSSSPSNRSPLYYVIHFIYFQPFVLAVLCGENSVLLSKLRGSGLSWKWTSIFPGTSDPVAVK